MTLYSSSGLPHTYSGRDSRYRSRNIPLDCQGTAIGMRQSNNRQKRRSIPYSAMNLSKECNETRASPHPPRKIGIPAAKVGNASGKEGSGVNELLQIYDCMVVETQLLFQHHTQLAQLSKAQWSGLTTSTGSCPGVASTQLLASGLCVACAAPTTTSSSGGQKKRKKSQQLSRAITCCFCGGKACASSCIVTCIGCSEAVCIRCASAALAPPATNF